MGRYRPLLLAAPGVPVPPRQLRQLRAHAQEVEELVEVVRVHGLELLGTSLGHAWRGDYETAEYVDDSKTKVLTIFR